MKPGPAIRRWINDHQATLAPELIATARKVERVVSSAMYASVDITKLTAIQKQALLADFLLIDQGEVERVLDATSAYITELTRPPAPPPTTQPKPATQSGLRARARRKVALRASPLVSRGQRRSQSVMHSLIDAVGKMAEDPDGRRRPR